MVNLTWYFEHLTHNSVLNQITTLQNRQQFYFHVHGMAMVEKKTPGKFASEWIHSIDVTTRFARN